jgi:hypothetical protein
MSIAKHALTKSLLSLAIASAFPAQLLAATSEQEIEALWQTIEKLEQKVAEAEEWKSPNTLIHMAGYADVNYVSIDTDNGTESSFSTGTFAPIFHYQVMDRVMLGAELAFTVDADGATEVEMEYFTIDYFLNDYATLVMGRFMSPLGQFRQNLHPSWINKLPSAPQGFGHGGAAPIADVGMQLRGGFKIGSGINGNYAAYVGNGVAGEINGTEVEEAHAPGFNEDIDGGKNIGGRFGMYLINSKVDLGLSWATGKAGEIGGLNGIGQNGTKRDWDFIGADFTWQLLGGLDIRGEYVKQTFGALGAGLEADFDAYYIQAAYRFPSTKWEIVARTSSNGSPTDTKDRTTAGVNYLFTSSVIAKVAYESNDNDANTANDKVLVQMAYGF